MAELTYKEQLQADYERIRSETRAGILPIEQRLLEIKEASERYVEARAEDYDSRVSAAVAEGKKPGVVPIPYKDDRLLDYMASLCMDEYLRWSHPDKMTIVEYPILSESQVDERFKKTILKDELLYGDIRHLGKRRVSSSMLSDNGESMEGSAPRSTSIRILQYRENEFDDLLTSIELKKAIGNADLTDRQKQALWLVYGEDMTQEDAAQSLGIRQQVLSRYVDIAITKIRSFMTRT